MVYSTQSALLGVARRTLAIPHSRMSRTQLLSTRSGPVESFLVSTLGRGTVLASVALRILNYSSIV